MCQKGFNKEGVIRGSLHKLITSHPYVNALVHPKYKMIKDINKEDVIERSLHKLITSLSL
jgi:hypothetical protein